jgi:hypothetical protein
LSFRALSLSQPKAYVNKDDFRTSLKSPTNPGEQTNLFVMNLRAAIASIPRRFQSPRILSTHHPAGTEAPHDLKPSKQSHGSKPRAMPLRG